MLSFQTLSPLPVFPGPSRGLLFFHNCCVLICEGEELRAKERVQKGVQKGKGTRADTAIWALWKWAVEVTIVLYFRLAKCRAVLVTHIQLVLAMVKECCCPWPLRYVGAPRNKLLGKRSMGCFNLLCALECARQTCTKGHLVCMVWLMLQKKHLNSVSAANVWATPGSHCFDFQPIAE